MCAKAEKWALTVCIVVNGEKFQSHAVTLTLMHNAQCRTCPSSFHILQYVQVSSGLKHYCLSYDVHRLTDTHTHTHTQKDRQTDSQTDGHEYSIVAVDKPQL